MIKKFSTIYFLVMALLVLSLSGCGSDGDNGSSSSSTSQTKQAAVITSSAFIQGETYRIYKGADVTETQAKYYVAPVETSGDVITLNLGFSDILSSDESIIIVDSGDDRVIFAYNPKGTEETDTETEIVLRAGGKLQKYTNTTITVANFKIAEALDIDISDAKEVILDGNSATIDNVSIKDREFVWHADPDHASDYFTMDRRSRADFTEDQVISYLNIGDYENYIAHDIRYMPEGLEYTATVKNDDETEYAAYYSDSVQEEVRATLGEDFQGPYIFATLPGGQGGMPNGERPPFPGTTSVKISESYNDSISSTIEAMTHSETEAYNNPVLHIREPGIYRLTGTWHGQIWIDGDNTDDPDNTFVIILDNVEVSCDVAPAIVFHENVYECGPTNENVVSSASLDIGEQITDVTTYYGAGAVVIIADGSENSVTGSNVYRMLKPEPKSSATTVDGTDPKQQKKLWKMDGAFYSFVSMVIAGEDNGDGILNITSSYEGLGTELHLTIHSGNINITAEDDGINVNEDNVSVFTMLGGDLTVSSENGDSVDSNGYIVIKGGTLDLSHGTGAEEALDSDCGNYVYDSDAVTDRGNNGNSQPNQPGQNNNDNNNENENPGDETENTEPLVLEKEIDENSSIKFGTSDIISIKDEDTTDRNIPADSTEFKLSHLVNDFGGITDAE